MQSLADIVLPCLEALRVLGVYAFVVLSALFGLVAGLAAGYILPVPKKIGALVILAPTIVLFAASAGHLRNAIGVR